MSTSQSTLTDLGNFLGVASSGAAAWYNGITEGTPVIASPQQAAANQIAINQASQIALAQTNPTLAGIFANPAIVLFIGIALIALLIFAFRS